MKTKTLTLFFGLLCFCLNAQEVERFSLEEAVAHAIQHSNEIKNAQINIADSKQLIVERRAAGIPQLNGGITYNYFPKLPVSLIPASFIDSSAEEGEFAELVFGTKNSLTASLDATALIFDGSYFVGLRAAKEAKAFSEDQYAEVEQQLMQKVRDAYFPALIIQSNLNTLQLNLNNVEKLRAETVQLNLAGFAEQLDVDRLDLSIANLKTEQENLERQLDLAYNFLKYQMSYPLEKEIELSDGMDKLIGDVPVEDLVGEVNYKARAEYRVMERAISLNTLNVQLQKAAYLPNLSGFGSYQYIGQGDNLFKNAFWNPTAVLGLQLNVPLFSGLMRDAKVERASFDLEKILNQKKDLERAILLEVKNARGNYRNAQTRVSLQKKNIELAQKIYDTAQIKYREGVGSSLEINQAENGLFTTQQNYTQALYDLLTAKTSLDKALGK